MKYLLVGENRAMGVEQIGEPRYRALCRFCGWRGGEQQYDSDALGDLRTHALSDAHREKVIFDLIIEKQEFDPLRLGLRMEPGTA